MTNNMYDHINTCNNIPIHDTDEITRTSIATTQSTRGRARDLARDRTRIRNCDCDNSRMIVTALYTSNRARTSTRVRVVQTSCTRTNRSDRAWYAARCCNLIRAQCRARVGAIDMCIAIARCYSALRTRHRSHSYTRAQASPPRTQARSLAVSILPCLSLVPV